MQSNPTQPRRLHPDDIVLWPDGAWATLEDVQNGHYNWRSDDFEIIDHTDDARLTQAGIIDEVM